MQVEYRYFQGFSGVFCKKRRKNPYLPRFFHFGVQRSIAKTRFRRQVGRHVSGHHAAIKLDARCVRGVFFHGLKVAGDRRMHSLVRQILQSRRELGRSFPHYFFVRDTAHQAISGLVQFGGRRQDLKSP